MRADIDEQAGLPSATYLLALLTSNHFFSRVRQRWQLYLFLAVPLSYIITFHYIPMMGAQIAFQDYSPKDGIWGSQWIGAENFQRFFDSYAAERVIMNTLTLGFYTLVAGFPAPIILALSLNQVRAQYFKKTVQLVTYAPHLISTVAIAGFIIQFLNPRFGFGGQLAELYYGKPTNLLWNTDWFQHIYVWSDIWQHTGFTTIIYLVALTSIDPVLYEAAIVDGASRFQRIWHIDIPGIMPMATIVFILGLGNFINVGFEKVLLLQNPLNLRGAEILDTYVYKVALASSIIDFSYATAIGLMRSIFALTLVVTANYVVRRMGHRGLW